jgi:hypothetical protein
MIPMIFSRAIVVGLLLTVAACADQSGPPPPLINSGSYDWTDQARDARGYPLPGWANAIGPNAGGMGL